MREDVRWYRCDTCGEYTTFEAKMKDGRYLCEKCLKQEKKPTPKVYPTNDKFIKFVRKYYDEWEKYRMSRYIMESGGKRCFTDGRILISELGETPVEHILVATVNKEHESLEYQYPQIYRVIPTKKPDCEIEIDKDFYTYAKAVKKSEGRTKRVFFEKGGIVAKGDYEDLVLNYRESDTSKVKETVAVQLNYMLELQPKVVAVHGKVFRFYGSYRKVIDGFPVIVVAGMQTD